MTLPPSLPQLPLTDTFGRVHTDLRIGVTDRCNLRCVYCMPEQVEFLARRLLLSYEEIARFVRIAAGLGIRTLRLTGGEPLVRRDLPVLVRALAEIPGIDEIALTTNGLLLADQAEALHAAGVGRLNVSLDALTEEAFTELARRPGLERVLEGLAVARRVGFRRIKINATAVRGRTESEVVPLADFARRNGFELRFIEFMPLDADGGWDRDQVLTGGEIRALLAAEFGPLTPRPGHDPSRPAAEYAYADGLGTVGFVDPVTAPFCARCNRLRLTADGKLRNCLFSTEERDMRALLRGTATDPEIAAAVRACLIRKKAGHGIGTADFARPERSMYQIGG